MKKTKDIIMNNMTLAIVRNIAYSQISKINKKIKEEIEVDSTLTKMIDINMKNAINKIINNYKQQQQGYIMITMKDLNELSIVQLQDTKVLIDTLVQNKMKRQFVIGTKVNVVQKTKKTPGVITKIMQSKCLVDLSGRIYRVSMSMLEMRTA